MFSFYNCGIVLSIFLFIISASDPCERNPCSPGVCTVSKEGLKCDCEGTFHVGERCETSFLEVSPIERMVPHVNYKVAITSMLPNDVEITVSTSNASRLSVIEPQPLLMPKSTEKVSINFTINAKFPGIYEIYYSLFPSYKILQPESSVALVVSNANASEGKTFFELLKLNEGLLAPGCCDYTIFEHSMCLSNITFSSFYEWKSSNSQCVSSNGVVFVSGQGIDLPLSVHGITIERSSIPFQTSLPFIDKENTEKCGLYNNKTEDCFSLHNSSFKFDPFNIGELLKHQSLALTLLDRVQKVFPSWLSVNIIPMSGTPSYSVYDYYSLLVNRENLKNIDECKAFSLAKDNRLYYLLRTAATLHIIFDSFNSLLHLQSFKAHCIIVDFCGSAKPKIHYVIPPDLQPVKLSSLEYFQKLLADNGELTFNMITFAKGGLHESLYPHAKYWNGDTYFVPLFSPFEFEVDAYMRRTFTGNDLQVQFAFKGRILYASQAGVQRKVCRDNV